MFPNVRTLDTNYVKYELFFHVEDLEKIGHCVSHSYFESYSCFVFIASHILTPKDFKKWNLLHVTHLSMKPAKTS